jgi:hypothetical protein
LKKQNSVIKRDDVVELLYLATKGSGWSFYKKKGYYYLGSLHRSHLKFLR